MDKGRIRELVKIKIAAMSEIKKKQESDIVSQKLISILSEKDFQVLVTYDAFSDEIDVSEIANWCREKWKDVTIIPQSLETFNAPQDGIIIVPGRAFTSHGKRVGRWSGFYDILLSKNSALESIGVCFDCQVFPDLPEDTWDERVKWVVFAWNEIE